MALDNAFTVEERSPVMPCAFSVVLLSLPSITKSCPLCACVICPARFAAVRNSPQLPLGADGLPAISQEEIAAAVGMSQDAVCRTLRENETFRFCVKPGELVAEFTKNEKLDELARMDELEKRALSTAGAS